MSRLAVLGWICLSLLTFLLGVEVGARDYFSFYSAHPLLSHGKKNLTAPPSSSSSSSSSPASPPPPSISTLDCLQTISFVSTKNASSLQPAFSDIFSTPTLATLFSPSQLHVNVTNTLLRQSRPIVGNVQRLHIFLKKLITGMCTVTHVLGGSVTGGHNAGGPKVAFPKFFEIWLNERWPCKGGNHSVRVNVMGGGNSQMAFDGFAFSHSSTRADLVILEFNVNDMFINNNPHRLNPSKTGNAEMFAMWYEEALLRKLLLLRKPDPVAIIYFSADFRGRTWADQPYSDPTIQRETQLFYQHTEPLTSFLASLYGIPVFSVSNWFLPMSGKFGRDMMFNRSYPFNTAAWHADACCHPPPKGHRLLAYALAYCFQEELSYLGETLLGYEQDMSAKTPPILRTPVRLSPEEDQLYVFAPDTKVTLSFDSQEAPGKSAIVANEGWAVKADNKEHDKFGLQAETSYAHAVLKVKVGIMSRLEVTYLSSYQDFGTLVLWPVNEEKKYNPEELKKICTSEEHLPKHYYIQGLGHEDERVSMSDAFVAKLDIPANQTTFLHLCLSPPSAKQIKNQEKNKFKVIQVSLA